MSKNGSEGHIQLDHVPDWLKKKDERIERILDVTFVEIKLMPGDHVEFIHVASGARKVEKIPPSVRHSLDDRAKWMQEVASDFVKSNVKPHG